jgi:hypothetical protein
MAYVLLTKNGGRLLRQNISLKQRKALTTKIDKVLKMDIRMLSKEMQKILVDDLVTAFLNRLDVLKRVNDSGPKRDLEIQCTNDTLELIHSRPAHA